MQKPRYRISITEPLETGGKVTLTGNAAHYIGHVLRMKPGDAVGLFNRTDGEFLATISTIGKRDVALTITSPIHSPAPAVGLTVCFVPIKGGRLETIIEKATELGADILQPVFSTRSVVDKINRERAEAIAREAAEQCERVSWPEIREPVKLLNLLADWPADKPLIYGDESGKGVPVAQALSLTSPLRGEVGAIAAGGGDNQPSPSITPTPALPPQGGGNSDGWGILAGPEGGFTADEFAALAHVKAARGVSLGPRILRADTAIITLCAATLMAWGDWHERPRFTPPPKERA